MNEERRDLNREDIRQLAGDVLDVLGVEKADFNDDERDVLRRALDDWRRKKKNEAL